MGYVIAAILVLLLVAGFVTFFVLNAARRPGGAAPGEPGAEGQPAGIAAPDESPRGRHHARSPRPARPRAGEHRPGARPRVGDPGRETGRRVGDPSRGGAGPPRAVVCDAEARGISAASSFSGCPPLFRFTAQDEPSSSSDRGANGAPVALSGLAGSPVVVTAPGIPAPGPPGPTPEPPAPAPPGPGPDPRPPTPGARAGTAAAEPEPAPDLTCGPCRRRRPRRRTTRC